jgi:hypothetical protein
VPYRCSVFLARLARNIEYWAGQVACFLKSLFLRLFITAAIAASSTLIFGVGKLADDFIVLPLLLSDNRIESKLEGNNHAWWSAYA